MEATILSPRSSIQKGSSGLQSGSPVFREIGSPEELFDTKAVIRDLQRIDWAFTQDDTSFLTHDIHPYPAKFIPQIPGHLIARLSLRGDLVFDPFGGSGTTALEAVRLGRRALAADANLVGLLAGRVKTSRLTGAGERDLHAIRNALLAHAHQIPDSKSLMSKYVRFIPDIPNRDKWFADAACAELALIRAHIEQMETIQARDVALIAMSRIILKASFQDSETRYTSRPRSIQPGEVLSLYLRALESVVQDVQATATEIRFGVAEFVEADTRQLDTSRFPDESVDLIVTSPPYGNAMDYHLYHRFRLFWLGADPRKLAHIEVGSHLRHQKEANGHSTYQSEMATCMQQMARVLRPGRYAAIVIGDSVYDANAYSGGDMIRHVGTNAGLTHVVTLERAIHQTKRSFVAAGRRATGEAIVVLQRPPHTSRVRLPLPPYRLWPYEERLRRREVEILSEGQSKARNGIITIDVDPCQLAKLRRLTFTHAMTYGDNGGDKTWQSVLENGLTTCESARKDPKYVTHGLHPYKGKFYPQLAKALINISGVRPGGRVFDPFCGSGTTLLEGYLNGLEAHGCDLNPLAAMIARAKLGILDIDPDLITSATKTLLDKVAHAPTSPVCSLMQFAPATHEEIRSWFPAPVIAKCDWLLHAIRSVSAGVLQDFFEVVFSSIVREVSNQDPTDLRIRRRKRPLVDSDVFGIFREALVTQYGRLEKFWSVRDYCPYAFCRAHVAQGDSRQADTLERCSVTPGSVDLILTSPPYATALPYIDTDRLSILLLCGLNARDRRPLEHNLTGSREITNERRRLLEQQLHDSQLDGLPRSIRVFVQELHRRMVTNNVGFRRRNMPSLLIRFFLDMQSVLANARTSLKPGAEAFVVMGDNATSAGPDVIAIPTTHLVSDVAVGVGMELVESIPITVTTENMVHVKNAIRKNVVLRFRRPA